MNSQLTHGQNLHREREAMRAADRAAEERHPPATKLSNGAWVLAAKASSHRYDVVLGFHSGAGAVEPFCVWKVEARGNRKEALCLWGDYYPTLDEAVKGFEERA